MWCVTPRCPSVSLPACLPAGNPRDILCSYPALAAFRNAVAAAPAVAAYYAKESDEFRRAGFRTDAAAAAEEEEVPA